MGRYEEAEEQYLLALEADQKIKIYIGIMEFSLKKWDVRKKLQCSIFLL